MLMCWSGMDSLQALWWLFFSFKISVQILVFLFSPCHFMHSSPYHHSFLSPLCLSVLSFHLPQVTNSGRFCVCVFLPFCCLSLYWLQLFQCAAQLCPSAEQPAATHLPFWLLSHVLLGKYNTSKLAKKTDLMHTFPLRFYFSKVLMIGLE